MARDQKVGAKYGLEYAEEFHYIGPDASLDEYIQRNAKPVLTHRSESAGGTA